MNIPIRIKSSPPSRQGGVVLFVALILLVILSLIGVTAARMQTVEERMARNEDNRQTGAQAAEAALRNAEDGLLGGTWNAANFAQDTAGLYELAAATGSQVSAAGVAGTSWQNAGAATVFLYNGGTNTGPALANIQTNAQAPKYVIENLPAVALPGQPISTVQYAAPTSPLSVFRVTAYGQGADTTSFTLLQSIFR
jgi:type IV pilus assembly protein PilX